MAKGCGVNIGKADANNLEDIGLILNRILPVSPYPVEQVYNFLASHQDMEELQTMHTALIGEGLEYVDDWGKSVYYHNFVSSAMKLLSEEEFTQVYESLRKQKGNITTHLGKKKAFSNLSNTDLLHYLTEEFREYAFAEGSYITKTPGVESLFKFIHSFYDNIDEMSGLLEGRDVSSFSAILKEEMLEKEDGSTERVSSINTRHMRFLNESMTVSLFQIAEEQGMDFSTFYNYKGDTTALYNKLKEILGQPSNDLTQNTVFAKLVKRLNATGDSLWNDLQKTQDGSLKEHSLDKEVSALLELLGENPEEGLLATYWNDIIKGNVEFLSKFDFDLEYELLQDNAELEEGLNEDGTAMGRDSLGIRAANEINPITRLQPHIKLIIRTLPEAFYGEDGGIRFGTNRFGTYRLADFGQTVGHLYRALSNKKDMASQIFALKELAQKDAKFSVLADRLGLPNIAFTDVADINKEQINTLLSFFTAFNNAEDEYMLLRVSDNGQRSLMNSNAERTDKLVVNRWQENFNAVIQRGIGKIKNGRYTIDLKATYKGRTVEEWLEAKHTINSRIEVLNMLGFDFENPTRLIEYVQNHPEEKFLQNTRWILNDVLKTPNLSKILFSNLGGRISKLAKLEAKTGNSLGTLLHTNAQGNKVYGITLKGFVNVLKDAFNEDGEFLADLEKSPTAVNSVYGKKLQEGIDMEIGVIEGSNNAEDNTGTELSNMSKADIAMTHINAILSGHVPLIRTGNKKLGRTIKVGDPDFKLGMSSMIKIMKGYLVDEVMTANAIKQGAATNIQGIREHGSKLQFFNDPKFSDIHTLLTEKYIMTPFITRDEVTSEINKSSAVTSSIIEYLSSRISDNNITLKKYNVVQEKNGVVMNIGLDNNHLSALASSIGEEHGLEGSQIPDIVYKKTLEQITFIQEIGMHEQFKLLLGHPAVYSDLFKRTSGLVSPKKYPFSDKLLLARIQELFPNKANPNRIIDGTARFVTREEVLETSVYKEKYKAILESTYINRPDLVNIIEETYTDMAVFDGGGMIHLDFYRLTRRLTDSWSDELENIYNKVIEGENITPGEIALLTPLKPQVFAPIMQDGIDIRVFNKFALYPLHPNLTRLIGNKELTSMDALYEDMNTHELDYMVFESGTKVGAQYSKQALEAATRQEQRSGFDQFHDEQGFYKPLPGPETITSIQTYDLKYFGIQQDPKSKRDEQVTAGTQSLSMLLTNIFDNGLVSEVYQGTPFSEEESWDQAGDRYHKLNSSLVSRDASVLATKLGFVRTPSGQFRSLQKPELIKKSILQEMERRDLPANIKRSIVELFDQSTNYIQQLYDKVKVESVLNSIITNTVIKRKMHGEMMVLQSNLGFELTQEALKEKDVTDEATLEWLEGRNKLRFYDKDTESTDRETMASAKTTAMEVYLPHYFKEFLGKELPDNLILSAESLEIIGFRIPTEGLNSIDFIKVVGFLPQTAGSTIIVPSEMVAKSGADYDIDKLTIYLPNTEIVGRIKNLFGTNNGTMQNIIPVDLSGEFVAQELERLRSLDLNTYKSIASRLLYRDTEDLTKFIQEVEDLYEGASLANKILKTFKDHPAITDIKAQLDNLQDAINLSTDKVKKQQYIIAKEDLVQVLVNKVVTDPSITGSVTKPEAIALIASIKDDLAQLDLILIEAGVAQLDYFEVQPKQVLQNDLQIFMKDVLSHPKSFDQLITPVGAFNIKRIAKEIFERKLDAGMVSEEPVQISRKLTLDALIDITYSMYQTLGGTGIVATGMTHSIKGQRAGLAFNTDLKEETNPDLAVIRFNFKGLKELSLSRVLDVSNENYINAAMQQYVTAFVDGEKDPFIMHVNGGKIGAAVHMLLLRTGVPLETVLYFMSQPIISDYLDSLNLNQSEALKASGRFKRKEDIKKEIIARYGGSEVEFEHQLDLEGLQQSVAQPRESMNEQQKATQVQILNDFIRYQNYGNKLRDLQSVTSYDRMRLKNGSEALYIQGLENQVREDNYFKNSEMIAGRSSTQQESFLAEMRSVALSHSTLFKGTDFKNSVGGLTNFMVQKSQDLIQEGKRRDDIIYTLDRFDNFLASWVILETHVGLGKLSSDTQDLFVGANSIPSRIKDLQELGVDNFALDSLLVMIDTYDTASYDATVDNLKLVKGKYDTHDLNDLVEEMRDLKKTHPETYDNLITFSLLQSSLDFSPFSFTQIMPSEDVMQLTAERFNIMNNAIKSKGVLRSLPLDHVWDLFISNNWHNPRIVQQRFIGPNNSKGLKEVANKSFTNERYTAKYITFSTVRNSDDGTYYSTFFERLDDGSYVNKNKLGLRNRLIETDISIIKSNTQQRERPLLQLGKDNVEKITKGMKTVYASSPNKGVTKSGEYELLDGSVVRLTKTAYTTKATFLKSKNVREELGIIGGKSLSLLSDSLGFEKISQAKEAYPGFFNGKSSLNLFTIELMEIGTGIINESAESEENSASTSKLTNIIVVNNQNEATTNENECL